MTKNKKLITVLGLTVFAVVLAVVLMEMSQPAKQPDILSDADMLASNVTPRGIDDAKLATITPEVKPREIVTPEPTAVAKTNDIPLTVIEEKPEPPEKPDTAHSDELQDERRDETIDTALTNPAVKPDVTPKPVEPTKPKETTPNSGDKNNKGKVYIPGFGWVKDEGGGGQGEKSQLDPEHSDFDKIIGY